jgi:hypothetical protein
MSQDVYDGIPAPVEEEIWAAAEWAQDDASYLVDAKLLHQAAKELPVEKDYG